MKGRSISVEIRLESSIFAFSAASFRRAIAVLSPRRSILVLLLKSLRRRSTIA